MILLTIYMQGDILKELSSFKVHRSYPVNAHTSCFGTGNPVIGQTMTIHSE